MCGIFGIRTKRERDIGAIVLQGLKDLEYRGYDSWGMVVAGKGGVRAKKEVGKISGVKDFGARGFVGIGHTRWATHGGVLKRNAHPHPDCEKRFWVVHNGIIENFEELKNELIERGHKFLSDTDTEVIAHLIEERVGKEETNGKENTTGLTGIVKELLNILKGHNAFVVLDTFSLELVAGKTGSPLVVARVPGLGNMISSDLPSLLRYTNKACFLKDGEVARITAEGVEVWGREGGKRKVRMQEIKVRIEQSEKTGTEYYYLREAREGSKVLKEISQRKDPVFSRVARILRRTRRAMIIGSGTSFFAGKMASFWWGRALGRFLPCFIASEAGAWLDTLKKGDVLVAFSQSGETIDVLEQVKRVKERGVKVVAFVNIPGSSLYQIAEEKVLLGAGLERAVVATKTFVAQLGVIKRIEGEIIPERGKQMGLELRAGARQIERVVKNELLKDWAKKLLKMKGIFVLGSGELIGIGEEIALKIKETAWYPAFFTPSRELKHGPLALIDPSFAVILVASREQKEEAIATSFEIKSRGGKVFAICDFETESFDEKIVLKKEGFVFGATAVGQLLGYYMAIQKGVDPDKPRNLAKSVTVK